MIVFIDFRSDQSVMAAIGSEGEGKWVHTDDRDGAVGLFAALCTEVEGLRALVTKVVVAGGEHNRMVTWSAVRTGIAFGNSLAFALDVPVARAEIDGSAARSVVADLVRAAANDAAHHAWVQAHYSGEPNITTPKKGV